MITVTRYIKGEAIPGFLPDKSRVDVLQALMDMFARLHGGAELFIRGFNYGLAIYDADPQSADYDRAIYGFIGTKLDQFLIDATKWWQSDKEVAAGSPDQDRFIRQALLRVTGHKQLTDTEWYCALTMPEDEFLAAMAMSVENGELVTELFRQTSPASS